MAGFKIAKRLDGVTLTFAVEQSNGEPRTGLVAADFVVTVRNPADSATLSPAPVVAEMGSLIGVYKFTVPSSFFVTHGLGDYAVTVVIDTRGTGGSGAPHVRRMLHDHVHVSETDFDGALAIVTTVAAGSTATEVRTPRTEADDFWNGHQIIVFSPTGLPVVRNVDDYALTNGAFTVTALPFTPVTGDRVIVLSRTGSASVNPSAIADAVWDELIAGHLSAGSTGATLARILQLAEPDVVIDKILGTITLKDRVSGAVLVVYSVTGILDTRVEELDG